MTDRSRRIQHTLVQTFGLRRLREGQRHVIERVLDGRATLAVMPTGAGKSLCYQLPALLLPARTLVVSPLIALMKDQCDHLDALGVAAVALHSALDAQARRDAEAAVAEGRARIVFITPEQLADRATLALLCSQPCSLLVVDEAHCIAQWGHDFRPAFLEIGSATSALGRPTMLALTATAHAAVIGDITQRLGIGADGVVNTGQYRANLRLAVEQVTSEADKLARVALLLADETGPALVYAATVKAAQAVHEVLATQAAAIGQPGSVGLYHGRLAAGARHAVQEAFMAGEVRVMVATNAFGLGIDKPDVRLVVHYQVPGSLDAYYQEAGRAGRDGEPARCVLLFLYQDRAVQQFFLANRYPAHADVDALYRALHREPPEGGAWTLATLQAAIDVPRSKLQVAVNLLRRQRIAALDAQGRLRLRRSGLGPPALAALGQAYQARRDEDRAMLEAMVAYAQSGHCRWRVLLRHFDALDEGFDRCGRCDNCRRMDEALRAAPVPVPAEATEAAAAPAAHDFVPGQQVTVRRYGRGVVTAASAQAVDVQFRNGEQRCFLPDYVAPAPAPRERRPPARAAPAAAVPVA